MHWMPQLKIMRRSTALGHRAWFHACWGRIYRNNMYFWGKLEWHQKKIDSMVNKSNGDFFFLLLFCIHLYTFDRVWYRLSQNFDVRSDKGQNNEAGYSGWGIYLKYWWWLIVFVCMRWNLLTKEHEGRDKDDGERLRRKNIRDSDADDKPQALIPKNLRAHAGVTMGSHDMWCSQAYTHIYTY